MTLYTIALWFYSILASLVFGASEQFAGPGKCTAKLATGHIAQDFYRDVAVLAFPTVAVNQAISKASILDIRDKMDASGAMMSEPVTPKPRLLPGSPKRTSTWSNRP